MRPELLAYYESELTFLRQMGAEFAEKYPKIASKLLLEPDRCEDPHTERLLEAFAFLSARVHLKLDDEFPEITNALLEVVYPHYLRPVPSMSVAEFHVDPAQAKPLTGLKIPRGSMLHSRAQVDRGPCKFQTCYETTLWPLTIAEAQWQTLDRLQPPVKSPDTVGVFRLLIRCLPDVDFAKLKLSNLRFYLNGESNLVHTMYELLCNNCIQILLRDGSGNPGSPVITLPPESLRAVGFSEDEALLPFSRRSFPGYRLLQEYFTFPEKFFFLELSGLDPLQQKGFKEQVEVLLLISRFERNDRLPLVEVGVTPSSFRLNCTPIVNLFPETAEPILLDQARYEYPVVADARRPNATEVFSVEKVVSTSPQTREVMSYDPFFSFRHGNGHERKRAFWSSSRRRTHFQDDQRADVFITLVDASGRPAALDQSTITVRCLCTNSDLPSRLPIGSESGDFELQGVATIRRITALRRPTSIFRPPTGRDSFWKLTSHLSLNYLSLVEEGREALQQILRLYNFSDSTYLESQISGIIGLSSSRHFARVISENGMTSARGTRIELSLDEEQFVGGGVYLFASVLEQFLGMYAAMNSFTQLAVSTNQRKGAMKEWPPRAGRSMLI